MIHFGLLRHGEVVGGRCFRGRSDPPLTDTGWQQMQAAVSRHGPWQRVVTSPLIRCANFAEDYAQKNGLSCTTEPRLMELDFGRWEGLTAEQIMADDEDALTRFWSDPDRYPPPDGESLAAMRTRVLAAWGDLLTEVQAADTEQRTLVVIHGGTIRLLIQHLQTLGGNPPAPLLSIQVSYGALWGVDYQVHTGQFIVREPTS